MPYGLGFGRVKHAGQRAHWTAGQHTGTTTAEFNGGGAGQPGRPPVNVWPPAIRTWWAAWPPMASVMAAPNRPSGRPTAPRPHCQDAGETVARSPGRNHTTAACANERHFSRAGPTR